MIDALRASFGSFGGACGDVPAPSLASGVIRQLLKRSGVDPAGVDEVVIGQGSAGQVAVKAGLFIEEIAPVVKSAKKGEVTVAEEEGRR